MYPGRRHATYNRPPGPPPPPLGAPPPYGYVPPPGPPPGPPPRQNNYGDYSRPLAPPPQQGHQSQYGNHGTYSNQYQPPVGGPPSQPQSFGQNTGMNFQYSQCTGQRKALLIGINYFGTKSQLRGCINDANAMRNFLIQEFGYKAEDIVILTDDQRDMRSIPTKQNIIRAMQWLVEGARPNDSLVFHYSGHGGLEKNLDGTEESGYDSCIYPVDFQTAGSIIDDVIHNLLVRPLPVGARLTAFFDSCHSGTAMDLPFVYSTKGVVKEPNMLKDVGMSGMGAIMDYARGDIGGMISSASSIFSRVTRGDGDRQQEIARNFSPADVIMLSGSKDSQTSADTTEFGMATGAMSYAFMSVMGSNKNQSYISLLNNMRSALSGKYSQKPQLSASHPIDVNLRFIM